jgi:hypothetical protein
MLDSTFSVHEIEAKWAVNYQKKRPYTRPTGGPTPLIPQDDRYTRHEVPPHAQWARPAGLSQSVSPRNSARISRSSSLNSICSNKSGRFLSVFSSAIRRRHRRTTS